MAIVLYAKTMLYVIITNILIYFLDYLLLISFSKEEGKSEVQLNAKKVILMKMKLNMFETILPVQ